MIRLELTIPIFINDFRSDKPVFLLFDDVLSNPCDVTGSSLFKSAPPFQDVQKGQRMRMTYK